VKDAGPLIGKMGLCGRRENNGVVEFKNIKHHAKTKEVKNRMINK
jgi:hypothetical protein